MKKSFLIIAGIVILIAGTVSCTSVAEPTAPARPPAKAIPKPGPLPEVKSVRPDSGPAEGGTEVVISGSNFGERASVTFGGTAASTVKVAGNTSISATTPPHPLGEVDVVVTNPDGTRGILIAGFTYAPPPRVSPSPKTTPTATPKPTPTPTPTPSPTPKYTLEITIMPSRAAGSVTLSPPGGTYASGTQVTLTAAPASGFRFVSWSGDLLTTINPIIILINGNKKVNAHFVRE